LHQLTEQHHRAICPSVAIPHAPHAPFEQKEEMAIGPFFQGGTRLPCPRLKFYRQWGVTTVGLRALCSTLGKERLKIISSAQTLRQESGEPRPTDKSEYYAVALVGRVWLPVLVKVTPIEMKTEK